MTLKILTLLACILHLVLPITSLPVWILLNSIALLILLHISGLTPAHLMKRNLLVVSFAVMIMVFQLITAAVNGVQPNFHFMGITFARILFVYNMIMVSVSWMGRSGLLWLVHYAPSERLTLFLLLFSRTVQMFMKRNRHIVFQLQSRIDTGSRKKYLVPRYYLQNLFAGEMYSLQHYQAGMMTRLHGNVRVVCESTISWVDAVAAVSVILMMTAGFIMKSIQV